MPDKDDKDKIKLMAQLEPGKRPVPIDAPPGGSLGLLALGYQGIIAWRAAREKSIAEEEKQK